MNKERRGCGCGKERGSACRRVVEMSVKGKEGVEETNRTGVCQRWERKRRREERQKGRNETRDPAFGFAVFL